MARGKRRPKPMSPKAGIKITSVFYKHDRAAR